MDDDILDRVGFALRLGRYKYFNDAEMSDDDIWKDNGRICYWPNADGNYYPYFKKLTDIEESTVSSFTNNTNYEYINHGTGRIVLKKDGHVIKFARYGSVGMLGDGIAQNCIEWNRYNDYKYECDYLTPIIESSDNFNWIKMPYINKKLVDETKYVQSKVLNEIESHVQQYFEMTDYRSKNVGYYDKNWRLLDYGQPERLDR